MQERRNVRRIKQLDHGPCGFARRDSCRVTRSGLASYRHYDRHRYGDYRGYYPRGYYRYGGPPRVYYRDHYYRDDSGAVIAAGVIGLAIGAAIASSRDRDRYYDRYDD